MSDTNMSQEAVMAKVQSGFNGGGFFQSPNLAPTMTITEGYPDEVTRKLQSQEAPQPMPEDTWFSKRGGR